MPAWPVGVTYPRVGSLRLSGRRVRLVLTVLAALMFSMHLVGVHVGHDGDSDLPAGTSAVSAHSAGENTLDHEAPDRAGASHHSSTLTDLDTAHSDLSCGEAVPARDLPPSLATCPLLRVVWAMEPLPATYESRLTLDVAHEPLDPVRELGLLRV